MGETARREGDSEMSQTESEGETRMRKKKVRVEGRGVRLGEEMERAE